MTHRNAADGGPFPTVVFLHVGKTAGLTFRRILRRQFSSREILELKTAGAVSARMRREGTAAYFASLPEAERARYRLIMGHTTFGIHEAIPGAATYITLLRDPVALTVSLYHFIRARRRHFLHDEVVSRNMTLEEFVRSGISLESDNSHVRAIAGDRSTPFGACTEEMLETAKRNIESHFSVVGSTERFDETMLLLRRAFGWTRLHYVPVNVASRKDAASSTTIRLIEEQNRLDVELYRWAMSRFDAAIRDDPRFPDELRRFRLANRVYRPWGHLTYTLPKRARDRLFPR